MKLKITFLATILISLVVSSCSQNEVLTGTEQIEKIVQSKGSYTLTTPFSEGVFELNELSTFESIVENFGIYKNINTQQVLLEDNDFEILLKDFSSFYGIDLSDYNLRGVVFYGDNVGINFTDFRNFTLITLDDGGYAKYISYEKQGNNLVLVENNPQRHSFIMINYFGYLGSKLSLDNNTMLTIINKKDFGLTIDPQININTQPENLERMVLNEYETIPYSTNGGHWCNMNDCDSQARGFCGINGLTCEPSSYVEDNECADDEAGGYYDHVVISPYGYKDAMYAIRDGFLQTTDKGKEYVDFYYKLSYSFKVLGIHESKEESLADLIGKIRLKSLAFMIAGNNDIIITNTEYTYLKGRINEFKILSTNEEYRYIFNKMDSDLEQLKNKTKKELKNYFND